MAAQSEAERLLALAKGEKVQVFMTTHSPSFYLLEDEGLSSFYVSKDEKGLSILLQGRDLEKFDVETAIGEGFYLPAVADALKRVATIESRAKNAEENASQLQQEIEEITTPLILTEGRTDATILINAWEKLRGGEPPFRIRSCETGGANAGSGNGGAQSLAICLKGVAGDHPHAVIGLFDYDDAGIKEFKLNKNFVTFEIEGEEVKKGMHGKSYAALLPIPDFRIDCGEHKNIPIEYLFRDEHLAEVINGHRLTLKRKQAFANVGGKSYKYDLDDVTHLKDIVDGKTDFSDHVVPTLPPEAFEAFDPVFEMIERIIEAENLEIEE